MTSNPFGPLSSAPQGQPTSSASMPNPEAPPTGETTAASSSKKPRRKKHRAGRKKRARKESFAPLQEEHHVEDEQTPSRSVARESLYDLQRNRSHSSLDSQALEFPRDQSQDDESSPSRTRSSSKAQPPANAQGSFVRQQVRRRLSQANNSERDLPHRDETTPLLASPHRARNQESTIGGSGFDLRRTSTVSSAARPKSVYDVNYPPSMPTTPTLGPTVGAGNDMSFGDVLIRDTLAREESPDRLSLDGDQDNAARPAMSPGSRQKSSEDARVEENARYLAAELSEVAEEEEEGEGEEESWSATDGRRSRRRRRRAPWPDLQALEAWRNYEKEQETSRRVMRITEPQLINGRLRPVHKNWFCSDDEMPFRFTYFNEELKSTIHSQTISGLIQAGGSFRELFIPDPPIHFDSEDDDDDDDWEEDRNPFASVTRPLSVDGPPMSPLSPTPSQPLARMSTVGGESGSGDDAPDSAPSRTGTTPSAPPVMPPLDRDPIRPSPIPLSHQVPLPHQIPLSHQVPLAHQGQLSIDDHSAHSKSPRYGDRPVWWLDVLSPTEDEMKVLSQTFGIHPLTAEDIMVQEAREKVELFHNYYFVNYRTFDQDPRSSSYMDPVNMYAVVFREGILTFHFSMTPHSANVRRRIRQLKDYLIVSSDWISYAIIDDITDVYGPVIQGIEEEVDDIDEAILNSWGGDKKKERRENDEKYVDDAATAELSDGDVVRRLGDCRRQVMSLYRLLGNKADVIKGFAKRCNEQYKVTPHSDIGLYLGDIQDHIVTMTSNLSHYEKILARAHQNHLAHVNVRMTLRSEQTADSLNKLTVLGTIVLPMNIITGLWGMNVWVPGQDSEGNLMWFVGITAGLIAFGFVCYFTAKRVYHI